MALFLVRVWLGGFVARWWALGLRSVRVGWVASVLLWFGGLLSLRGFGSVWPLGWGICELCPESRGRHARTSLSEVYGPGKLHWHLWFRFVAGFAVLKGLLIVPVGTMGSF